MARSVDEWKGKSDDTVPPPRVRIAVFEDHKGKCYICGKQIRAGEYWQCDHVVALANGGENRQGNLKPACRNCCYDKTAKDVAEKSKVATIKKKSILPKPKSRMQSRGFRSTPPRSKDINDL